MILFKKKYCPQGFLFACSLIFSLCVSASAPPLEVYKEGNSWYLTINRNTLHQDIFITTRVMGISGHKHIAAGQTFHPGKVFHFVQKDDQLLFEERDYSVLCDPDQNVYDALQSNQTARYPFAFPIYRSDPASVTIDITRFFGEEIPGMLPMASNLPSGKFNPDASGIYHFDNHPDRINIQSELIYTGSKNPFSMQLNYNLLLMDDPIEPRLEDPRVGYLTRNYRRLTEDKPIERLKYITRWDLQPKDKQKYLSGEPTEVEHPIIFYLDPTLPAHVAHYATKGILDWNMAFEAIGLKDVIQVRNLPEEENFNIHDISVNVLRYIPESRENAMGATLVDPRSGEILQADIYWYHDLEARLRKWRFVQTAACDPAAREEQPAEEVMGEMIRYVAAHEMGHVLGLRHNMRGSFAYPVDSLRSASFTSVYGTTASIMDYARFNYVAQPGDLEKGVGLLPPRLGPYDYMAIEWGYRPVPEEEQEYTFLSRIIESKNNDPMYLFAPESRQEITSDPSAQTDVLGDNVIHSSQYGIRNLKYITENLYDWLSGWSLPKEAMKDHYEEILDQFFLYLYSSASYVGGTYYFESGTRNTAGGHHTIDQETGLQALDFILRELLHAPDWLTNERLDKILGEQRESLLNRQNLFLKNFLNTIPRRFALHTQGDLSRLFEKMTEELFAPEAKPDLYRTALRATYLHQLKELASLSPQRDPVGLCVSVAAENEINRMGQFIDLRLDDLRFTIENTRDLRLNDLRFTIGNTRDLRLDDLRFTIGNTEVIPRRESSNHWSAKLIAQGKVDYTSFRLPYPGFT